jgi:glycosyltransferase involved in cell wall biosynthesis
MYDLDTDRDARYIDKINFKGFKGLRFLFVTRAVTKGIRSDLVILSHINLLFVAVIIKRLSPKTRIIVYAHGIEIWREIKTWKQKFLSRKCEIWAVSEFTSGKLQDNHQIPAANITVIPNCLDPYLNIPKQFQKPVDVLNKYGLTADQPVLFTLTRLSSHELYKGYDIIIEALPLLIIEFPKLHYLLAGLADSQERARLTSMIEQLGLQKHITLTGFIPDEKLCVHFLLADVFVMPSLKEGFGIVFIEAAAYGCKIIAGNQDGSPQALLQGRLGTLIHPGEKETLIRAIIENLRRPRSHDASKVIQSLCLEYFNYEQYLKRVERLLTEEAC